MTRHPADSRPANTLPAGDVLEHRVLGPVGAEVTDLRVAADHPAAVTALRRLLADHGMVVMPGRAVDDGAFLAFLAGFGPLTFTRGETPVPGYPDLNVVSNVGRRTPRSVFHVDTSYVRRPPAYTALRAVEVPARGGHTLFTNQYRAYETLPPGLRAQLAGRTIRHVATGVDAGGETAAEHPALVRHPVSGRTALYLSTPERCVAISGMGDAQSEETIGLLYAHSTAARNVHRHAWSPGDLVMWDNRCVMHRADHTGVVGARVLHRATVAAGAAPEGA